MLIRNAMRSTAKWILRHLSPASRAIVVRDSVPTEDLAENLPRHVLMPLFLDIGRKLDIPAIRINGDYGPIEGTPKDRVILRRYAITGTWSPRFQSEIIDRIFSTHSGTLIDVGANIGLTAIPAVKNHGLNCVALEPDPTNFDFLKKNISHNKLEESITPLNIAAYSSDATLSFELSPDNLGDHRIHPGEATSLVASLENEDKRRVIAIEASRLDDILLKFNLDHPLVVKVDTQGSEPLVFKGASATFSETDCLIVEFSPYTLARLGFDTDDFFSELGMFKFGHILPFDHSEQEHTIDFNNPSPIEVIISKCREAAALRSPENYFDLALFKQPMLLLNPGAYQDTAPAMRTTAGL